MSDFEFSREAFTRERYRALVATQPEIASEVTLAVGRGLSLTLLHDS